MFKSFTYIENLFYRLRDFFWNYPDTLFGKNSVRTHLGKLYSTASPYSNFVSVFVLITLISLIISQINIKTVLGQDESTITEAVIMGTDIQGRIQTINKINPIIPTNVQLERDLVDLIYQPLVKYEYNETKSAIWQPHLVNVLASDVNMIKNGADYIFNLRKDVKWHDGSGFKADDVVATFNLISSLSRNDNAYIRAIKQLKWEKINDYSIRVCTKSAVDPSTACSLIKDSDKQIFSNFLELISVKILPSSKIGDINDATIETNIPQLFRSPDGTGRYEFQYATDKSIRLMLNNDYVDYIPLDSTSILYNLYNKYYSSGVEDKVKLDSNNQITEYTKKNNLDLKVVNNNGVVQILSKIKPKINIIEFKYYRDLPSAVAAIENGEVDTLATVSVQYKTDIAQYTNINTNISPVLPTQYWGLYFNLKKNPDGSTKGPSFFQDIRVRQAISSAINRTEIINNALLGVGEQAYGPIPIESQYYNGNAGWYTFDPIKSNKLLDSAGWTYKNNSKFRSNTQGQELGFSLYFVDTYDRSNIAKVIQKDLADVGLNLNIDRRKEQGQDNSENAPQGWSLQELNDQVLTPKSFDMILYGMDTFIDPDRYELFDSSQQDIPGLNISAYTGTVSSVEIRTNRQPGQSSLVTIPKIDKLLQESRAYDPQTGATQRINNYNEVQSLIAQDSPVIFLYTPQFVYYVNSRVKNIDLINVSGIEDRFKNINNWIVK